MSKLTQEELNEELLNACWHGYNIEMIKLLIDKGANIEVRDRHGETPLHLASSEGHLEIVKYLVELGTDVNVGDDRSDSPLRYAYDREVINYLKSKGGCY